MSARKAESGDAPRRPAVTRMVDVGEKPLTARRAVAEAHLRHGLLDGESVLARAREPGAGGVPPLEAARLAGILAGKRTAEILPLCHPLPLDHLAIEFAAAGDRVRVVATAACRGATGVEMEAMTAAAFAALALAEALEDGAAGGAPGPVTVEEVRLLEKSGGRSGDWRAAGARTVA